MELWRPRRWCVRPCLASHRQAPSGALSARRSTGNCHDFARQLPPYLVDAVDLHVGLPDALNLWCQHFFSKGPGTAFMRLAKQRCMSSISPRGDLQDLPERLDPEGLAMLVDEVLQDLSRRSSSAWAKNALASFNISLALHNSLTSRSRSLTRWASLVVTPSRTPASTSDRLAHSLSVCGTQPILGAMDSIAAHNDGYSHGAPATSSPHAHRPRAKTCSNSS